MTHQYHNRSLPKTPMQYAAIALWALLPPLTVAVSAETAFKECSDSLGLDLGNSKAAWADQPGNLLAGRIPPNAQ